MFLIKEWIKEDINVRLSVPYPLPFLPQYNWFRIRSNEVMNPTNSNHLLINCMKFWYPELLLKHKKFWQKQSLDREILCIFWKLLFIEASVTRLPLFWPPTQPLGLASLQLYTLQNFLIYFLEKLFCREGSFSNYVMLYNLQTQACRL